MNKRILGMVLSAMIAIPCLAFAEENTNLLKNSELKMTDNGLLPSWTTWHKCKFNQDAGYKGQNSVRMVMESGDDLTAPTRIVLTQNVENLKPGKYIFSANIKLDRGIQELSALKCTRVKGEWAYDGKAWSAEPGTWTNVSAEFDIPEGINSASFAISFRDAGSGATVWVDSPALYKVK